MRSPICLAAFWLSVCVAAQSVRAAEPSPSSDGPFSNPDQVRLEDYFPPVDPELAYDATVPRPQSVLGHEIGSRYARHDLVVAWFEALAELSPRVTLIDIGRTHEGRRQIVAVISSATNMDNLQDIQRAHLAGEPGTPIFTWHGFSIHGNEASGVQAAMAVAWHLAASRDPDDRAMLRNTVIMIDPALNPDGYGRFSTWANHSAGRIPVGDPAHRERVEPWPGGRTNHYFFDLNRDWLLQQQPETVNRVRLLQQYRPHVMTDHHEMSGDRTFFFQPGVATRWHPMIPEANRDITERLAAFHARALDRAERVYYSGETYDDFYPGKASTWPDLQGTVGILFEQASTRGLVRDTEQGRITLPMAVHNHVLATLSTLEGVQELADDIRRFREDYEERRHVPGGLPGAWVFDDGGDPSRAAAFVELIKGQGLDVFGLSESVRAGNREYLPGRAWVVPVLGAKAALAHTLFADVRSFADSTFYDVSTWALPHAFGVSASRLSRVPSKLDTESHVNRNYAVSGRTEPVAWVLPWDDFFAPAVLARLQMAGVRARVALEPFDSRSSGQPVSFKAGAVVIHQRDVPDVNERKRDFLARIAAGDAPLVGLDSGFSDDGPDLGSPRMRPLTPATVALVAGDGANSASVGGLWHALDYRMGVPVTLVRPDRLNATFLDRHTHLVIGDGSYGGITEEQADELARWVEKGGVVILTGRATAWAQSLDWLPEPDDEEEGPARYAYGDMAAQDGARQIGGAILKIELDRTHPIAFGIAPNAIGLMRQGRVSLKAPWNNPFTVVGAYADDALLSGYLPDGYAEAIAGEPAILAFPKGDGVIVAFADAPAFRGVWWVGQRLVANAISFGSVIRGPRARYGPGSETKR